MNINDAEIELTEKDVNLVTSLALHFATRRSYDHLNFKIGTLLDVGVTFSLITLCYCSQMFNGTN